MALVAMRHLSGGSHGRNIKVAATSTPGTTVHTAVSGTTDGTYDQLYLWAVNSDTTARKLTIEFGGTTSPDDLIEQTIPAESGLVLVIDGLILRNGSVVRAFAASANVVMVNGYVHKVTA
jgi:hypothetical protein